MDVNTRLAIHGLSTWVMAKLMRTTWWLERLSRAGRVRQQVTAFGGEIIEEARENLHIGARGQRCQPQRRGLEEGRSG